MAKADKQLQDDFPFYKDEKTALFIDGANLYAATKRAFEDIAMFYSDAMEISILTCFVD